MATIKAIEARSVHQIQSGQIIVDLNSVIKELVENSLDAGATSIEVRFRNSGLDLIEVQDNGSGIAPENYENVALKHYTSKLSSYDDLLHLQTFGFRGEALSSLCALSDFRITTAQVNQAPRATRLEFEQSGKLRKKEVVAGQKGTTASVESLFKKLPVRRRELEKNIKREYGKVLNLLHAYACISTGVRFSVKNTQAKKTAVVFATNGNQTTKENIANVYGAKTLFALIPLDLELEFEPSVTGTRMTGDKKNRIQVRGHISRPVFGEGRQTPDRQMLFVNSRPCALPQITKAINEVYKSFNVAQSPFIFADFHMDTNAYDVNVSPDKRTILLHDAGALIESLKQSLQKLFESADQTVPQSQILGKLPLARQRSLPETTRTDRAMEQEASDRDKREGDSQQNPQDRMKGLLGDIRTRDTQLNETLPKRTLSQQHFPPASSPAPVQESQDTAEDENSDDELFVSQSPSQAGSGLQDDQHDAPSSHAHKSIPDYETPNTIQNAFDRMRPRRLPAEMATITIGNRTVTSMVGSGVPRKRNTSDSPTHPARKRRIHTPSRTSIFGHMQDFAAPRSQVSTHDSDNEQDSIEDEEDEGGSDGLHEDIEAEAGKETVDEVEDQAEEEAEDAKPFALSDDNATQSNEHIQTEPQPPEEDMNADEKRRHEDAEVQRLIEEAGKANQANSISRANKLHKGVSYRDSTVHLATAINASLSRIESQADHIHDSRSIRNLPSSEDDLDESGLSQVAPEERLTLTVNKDDFARMRIHGQFNLGFILASRSTSASPRAESDLASSLRLKDELFIIDQHASDEKINFERLQSTTTVQNQRLVHPKRLDLTAVEEEIVIENQIILEKNGFVVDVDDSGDKPIGQRCSLLSLPLSKEVVFDVRDLEELIAILSETSTSNATDPGVDIPRPSKVRKMFAMRACRSSIMIGKTLTQRQMERVVRDMGTIDKPWNCPHGRPTMRHLFSLGRWGVWDEYADIHTAGRKDGDFLEPIDDLNAWREYVRDVAEELNE
ncbi:hypothetical protein BDW72DRAFT_213501 [Aspergillus terricola var. indicus]